MRMWNDLPANGFSPTFGISYFKRVVKRHFSKAA